MVNQVTNQEFLTTLFGDDACWAHVTSFMDDPANIPNENRFRCWSGNYNSRISLQPNSNQYFTISTFYADEKGKARRRKALFRSTHVIVADDVKEKLPEYNVNKLPPPTYKLETSPGSEQWGWVLDHPCQDRAKVENLLDGLVEQGLAPAGKDPGMKGVTRYVRLPEGVNTKAKRVKANGGTPPRCKLLEWHPERRVSIEELAEPFEVDLDAERRDSRVDGAANLPDHPLLQLTDIIHVKSVRSKGRFDITCPWVDEHTDAADDGAAIFTNENGSIGFKCHHGACEQRNGKDLLDLIEITHSGFRADLKMYCTIKEFELAVPVENKVAGQDSPARLLSDIKYRLSDVGNAQRLANDYRGEFRYCPEHKSWMIWKTQRWVPDIDDAMVQFAIRSVRKLYNESGKIKDDELQVKVKKWCLRSEFKQRLDAAISIARTMTDIPIHSDQMDSDPLLLNVEDGTIDLKTGKLRPHDKLDYITKLVKIKYSEATEDCSNFHKFIYEIMDGDDDLIDYLQRVVGYSLTGNTKEQCIFFLHGYGANGKSTLINILFHLASDYAIKTTAETFMTKQNTGNTSSELAALVGKRVVAADETEEGKRLAEATIKQLCGGDIISARKLYCEPFNFLPTFKIFIAGNHKPQIRGGDYGIWRRIHLIPFTMTFPPEKQDKHLYERLEKEFPAILKWAVEGCLKWQEQGLSPPRSVVAAVDDYRENMDVIGQWLEECCRFGPGFFATSAELYRNYKCWAQNAGYYPMSQKRLGETLRMRGREQTKVKGVRGWQGITVDSFKDVTDQGVVV